MTKDVENGHTADSARLHERVAELEQMLVAAQARVQALEESETRLRFVVEGSSDGAWDWNLVSNEAFLSPRWFEMIGYGPEELPNNANTWFERIHPDDVASVQQALQDYMSGAKPSYEVENRLLHKSGQWLWTMGRGKIVARDPDTGQPLRMTGTISDISARKQAEEALRQSQRLLQGVIENSPAVIYVRDISGRFLLVNNKHAALLQRPREEIIGKADYDLFPAEVVAAFRANDKVVLESGKPIEEEEFVPHDDGLHTYLSVKFPLYDDDGTIYGTGGISTDITEKRRAEEERAALQQQIIDAQRLSLQELSTPLIPITDEVVIMPLIGTIDSQRAQQVIQILLEGVSNRRSQVVILDITGVQIVDTHVASALLRAAQAVKLLGAEVMITGIRPEVAQTIVGMGADMSSVMTHGSLQSGIAFALRRRNSSLK